MTDTFNLGAQGPKPFWFLTNEDKFESLCNKVYAILLTYCYFQSRVYDMWHMYIVHVILYDILI